MKKILIIGTVFPEPTSTAAGTRMLQLIELFQENGCEITFLSSAATSEHSYNLEKIGVAAGNILLNDDSTDGQLRNLSPDIVIFDRFMTEEQFGWKINENCPNALKILDTEDLHFLRKAREKAFKSAKTLEDEDLISDIFKREIASILRCDLSLVISEFEFKLLKDKFNIDKNLLFYLPMFATPNFGLKSFEERKNFISIGNFLHEPNWQTVLQLKKLWPKIKSKIPEAELHIYGAYATEKAKQLHNEKEKFLIKGRAENLEETFNNARVLLAPIPFGAGIKGKLLDSMRLGLPSVTTPEGAEAMHGNLPWNGFICENEDDFISKSVTLYKDEITWQQARKNGLEIIQNRFCKKNFKDKFLLKVNEISENLAQHRQQNFLGQILQHHSLQSAKYLGKWIEEKNKK